MGVQVVHHQCYLLGFFVLTGNIFQEKSPVPFGSSLCDFDKPSTCQWLTGEKNIAYATTLTFIVMPCSLSRLCRNRNLRLGNELLWGFVHAYHRKSWIQNTLVHVQHHFHVRHKASILFRRDHPSFSLPRLEFVFFKTRRTVS